MEAAQNPLLRVAAFVKGIIFPPSCLSLGPKSFRNFRERRKIKNFPWRKGLEPLSLFLTWCMQMIF